MNIRGIISVDYEDTPGGEIVALTTRQTRCLLTAYAGALHGAESRRLVAELVGHVVAMELDSILVDADQRDVGEGGRF